MATRLAFEVRAGGTVTVDPACTLIVFAISRDTEQAGTTGTLGGTALDVATNSNGYTAILYRLNPASGSQAVVITPNTQATVLIGQYSGVSEFASATESSAASQSRTISRGGLLTFVMSAVTAPSHTELAGTRRWPPRRPSRATAR